MKISIWWMLLAATIGIAAAVIYFKYFYTPDETISIRPRMSYDIVTLTLPKDSNPAVFGPKYWQSFHRLSENIPCPSCQEKAVPFMKFFHDLVNFKTQKPIFDKDNFNKHIDIISKIPKVS